MIFLNELRGIRDYFIDRENWNERSRLDESRLGLDKLYVIRYDLREILSGNSCPYTPDGIDIIFLIFCKETLLYFNFDIAKLCE